MLQMAPKPHSISILQQALSHEPPVTPLQSFAEVVVLLEVVVLVELVVAIPPSPPLPLEAVLDVPLLVLGSTSEPQAHTVIATTPESPRINDSLRIYSSLWRRTRSAAAFSGAAPDGTAQQESQKSQG